MKYLKTYQLFESSVSGLTKEQEEFLNKHTEGSWKHDPATGLVDVEGDFDISYKSLDNMNGIKFGRVGGDFNCSENRLTSLEGAPREVGGNFDCSGNKLTSLEGAPREVGGSFDCEYNKLTSLEGAPQKVGKSFHCQYNKLTSLKGAPQKVGWDFKCYGNKLTSLEGAPKKVGKSFHCQYNKLTSLKGAPQEIDGDFFCFDNSLTSLKGAPQKVSGNFSCSDNNLSSLEGAPREVGEDFGCIENKLTSLEGAPQEIGGDFFCGYFPGRKLPKGKWNVKGWLEILKKGKPKAQSLILTLISPDVLNREIQKNPAGMIMKLKSVWNSPEFKDTKSKLVWPRGYEEEMELVGGLNTIGF